MRYSLWYDSGSKSSSVRVLLADIFYRLDIPRKYATFKCRIQDSGWDMNIKMPSANIWKGWTAGTIPNVDWQKALFW